MIHSYNMHKRADHVSFIHPSTSNLVHQFVASHNKSNFCYRFFNHVCFCVKTNYTYQTFLICKGCYNFSEYPRPLRFLHWDLTMTTSPGTKQLFIHFCHSCSNGKYSQIHSFQRGLKCTGFVPTFF